MRDPADPTRYWVESDNQTAPGVTDSWTHGIGSLAREQIRALVLFRLPRPIPAAASRAACSAASRR